MICSVFLVFYELEFIYVVLLISFILYCYIFPIQAITLEQEAYPTLDKLTSVLSTLNLERVRQIKSRLIEISGRVQKVERINGSEPKKKKISLQYGLIHCDDRTSPLLIYTLDYTKELYYNNVFFFFLLLIVVILICR